MRTQEWSDRNKYSSFNSWKGLTYYANYQRIMAWMRSEVEYLPPPVECNLDPFAECNARCYFCVNQRYLRSHREEVGEMRVLPFDYMCRLVDYLSGWGVRGLCISGGGDPSLHPDVPKVIARAVLRLLDVSLNTNAIHMPPQLMESLLVCRWMSLSVDCGDKETYKRIKGVDKFLKVIRNIETLMKKRQEAKSDLFAVYKILLLPENVDSLYATCKLAKELGVPAVHIRPADFEREDIEGHRKLAIPVGKALEQFALCHELESLDFKVFTVTHKFDGQFHVKHDFTKCLATPLLMTVLADGNSYLCVDKKMEAKFRLGSAYPNPEKIATWWGSAAHREMIKNVDIEQCFRCTFGQYSRQIENVVEKDNMMLAFP